MNTLITMLEHPVAVRIGWSLVHLLWQGILVALLLAGVLWLLRRRSANARYLCAGAALLLLPVLFVATFATVEVYKDRVEGFSTFAAMPVPNGDVSLPSTIEQEIDVTRRKDDALPSFPAAKVARVRIHNVGPDTQPASIPVGVTEPKTEPPASIPAEEPASLASQAAAWIEPVLPWVVGGWLVGFALLSLWHAGGWIALRRLRTLGTSQVTGDLSDRFDALCNRLGLRSPIGLLQSTRLTVPSLIGMLKPVVLLPVGVLTGLTPGQLEAVLAHELAHVRRHDFLANLIQTAIETLLFFHPAVWWMSRRIRIERENCCDDIAIAALNDPVFYAKSLTRLEELRHQTLVAPALSLAASGGSLLDRIHRVLGVPRRKPRRVQMSAFGLSGIAGLLALVAASLFLVPATVEDAPAELQKGKTRRPNEWHQLIKGKLATVSVYKALYEKKGDKYFHARVRIANETDRAIGVDLKSKHGIRINQWGASATKQRGIIDEARTIRDPFKAADKAKLTAAFRKKKLQMIPAGKSIEFFRAFNGRDVDSVRKAVDAAKGKHLILSMDGEVRVTNGTAVEVLGCGKPGDADVVIEQPVTWKTVPAGSRILPRDLVAVSAKPVILKQVKSPKDRGKMSDAVMKINGERNRKDTVIMAAGPKPKPGVKSLSAWYYQPRKGNELAEDRETWVLFRSKQMNDNDRMWVHSVKREKNTFTVFMQRTIWSGEYFENLTFHEVHGINLGKLPVGKYAVHWVIASTGFKELDKAGWPKPLPAGGSRSVDRVTESFVVNAGPGRKVPQPAKWNPRSERRPKAVIHNTVRLPAFSKADDFYRAKPLEQMPAGDIANPEAVWYHRNRKAKFNVTTQDNNWLMFQTKQADDHVKTWVTGIERKGNNITVRMTRSIWSGAYTYNRTYHDIFAVKLGKLPAGKYRAKWIIDQASHTKYDNEGWPTDGGVVKKNAVVLSTSFIVEDAKKKAEDRKREASEKKDLAALNGTWEVQHTIKKGRKIGLPFDHYRWIFDTKLRSITTDWKEKGIGGKRTVSTNRFTLDVLTSPKQLTITGPRLTLKGIYEFKGKTLRIGIFGIAEKDRPKSFDHTAAGKGAGPLVIFVLKRKEKPKPKVKRGAIRAVDPKTKIAWINLGSADKLKAKTTFEVRGTSWFPGLPGALHGTVEVTRIVGPHLAEARIVSEELKNPIAVGDDAIPARKAAKP